MSDDSALVPHGTHAGLFVLTESNFTDWDMQIIAYLTGSQDHARVISPTKKPDGNWIDPVRPSLADASATDEVKKKANEAITNWDKSEGVVLGCFMATAGKLQHHHQTLRIWRTSLQAAY